MKRKKASKNSHKKSNKKKTTPAVDVASSPSNANYDEELASEEKDAYPRNSNKELQVPLISPDETGNPANSDTATSEAPPRQPVYTRVKVKLKSMKPLQPSATSVEHEKDQQKTLLLASDTSTEKKEGSNYSDGRISDLQPSSSGKSPRKAGSIKIISSKGVVTSKIGLPEEPTVRDFKLYRRRDHSAPRVDPRYNENELKSSLVVIKKIMRMEAAEPFNTPVDPIALGIPDYFEVIETPMDFGTICEELQKGKKYWNSKDVFKDVQFIWENCYKYNNKGDYILDLMKRVKRNFMKYWTAAGLSTDLSEQSEGTHAESSIKVKESKAKSMKSKRKRSGIDLHKSDCLCAVCVVRRRRREREEQSELTDKQTETSEDKSTHDFMEEKTVPEGNSPSERSSSSVEEIHEHDDTLEGMEGRDKEEILETKRETSEMVHEDESSGHRPDEDVQMVHDDGVDAHDFSPSGDEILPSPVENLGREMAGEKVVEKSMYESPSRVENLAVVEICRALFGTEPSSVWRGPHSLTPRQPLPRHSPIHAALSSFFGR